MKYQARLAERFEYRDYVMFVRGVSDDGKANMMLPLQFGDWQESPVPTPTLEGPECLEIVQAIVDAAWEGGIRPTAAAVRTDATDRHLEDMRLIAFHKLGIKTTR